MTARKSGQRKIIPHSFQESEVSRTMTLSSPPQAAFEAPSMMERRSYKSTPASDDSFEYPDVEPYSFDMRDINVKRQVLMTPDVETERTYFPRKHVGPSKLAKILIVLAFSLGVLTLGLSLSRKAQYDTIATSPSELLDSNLSGSADTTAAETNPKSCTPSQMQAIEEQLPTDAYCWGSPWKNLCPISNVTVCPRPTWLWNYYANNDLNWTDSTFLAVVVGCNNAFKAIQTLRMGSFDASISVYAWKTALNTVSPDNMLLSCDAQNPDHQIEISVGSIPRNATLFCLDPVPINYDAVTKANEITNYQGLKPFHYSVADQPGTHYFPIMDTGTNPWEKLQVGTANMYIGGHASCDRLSEEDQKEKCTQVEVVTLDSFAERYVPKEGTINVILSQSNVDYEVLAGATQVLQRTEYIEFGFSWKGTWAGKNLMVVIDLLDNVGFSCYWAGTSKLWRITHCWREAYDTAKFIASVACVNRNLNESKTLAEDMERLFLQTIGELQ